MIQFSLMRLAWLFLLQTEWTSQWGNFESRTEIQQTPPTILPEEVRIDRQNPKFLGNNICQPPARYIANSPLFPYIQCFLAYNVRLLLFWVFSRNVTRHHLHRSLLRVQTLPFVTGYILKAFWLLYLLTKGTSWSLGFHGNFLPVF